MNTFLILDFFLHRSAGFRIGICIFVLNRFIIAADYSSEDEEESVYETLSDSAPHTIDTREDDAYDDAKQEDSNLTKIAEAAGRGFKKLRRNWSIKKEDLTKGFSKIKRSSKNLIEDVYTKEGRLTIIFTVLH